MQIRWYQPGDDDALMALERQCPRGEPNAFVHWRHRFIDRAAIFASYALLLVEADGAIVACAAAAIKDTVVQKEAVRLAYIFDVRVAPPYRRQGLALTLLTGFEQELITTYGCDGAYAHIVATNLPSLRLFDALGYKRRRQLRLLSYAPFPLFTEAPVPTIVTHSPPDVQERAHYGHYDLWVEDTSCSLVPYGLTVWRSAEGDAQLTTYQQHHLFQQVPADAPWPSEAEIAKWGGHWRLFHPYGEARALERLFAILRDSAITENVNRLSLLVDAEDPIPTFFFAEAQSQREYTVLTHPYTYKWDGTFGRNLYCDTREL